MSVGGEENIFMGESEPAVASRGTRQKRKAGAFVPEGPH